MDKTTYLVRVKTGDKKFAGTDANVRIIIHGNDGRKTEETLLDNFFKNDFEIGSVDTFIIESDVNIPTVERIEIWRDAAGILSAWFVDWIEIKNEKTMQTFIFPVFRWIKEDRRFMITHLDTSLPQFDPYPDQRTLELMEKRKEYQLVVKVKNLMAQVSHASCYVQDANFECLIRCHFNHNREIEVCVSK